MTERSEDPQEALLREAAQAVVLAFGPHRHSLMFEDDEIIALNRALAGQKPRVRCICGRAVLPENWDNHLLRQRGRHALAAEAAPPRSDDLETVCHAILGGTSYLSHREAAQRLLARAAPPPDAAYQQGFADATEIYEARLAAPPPSLVQVQGDTAGGGTPLDDDYEDGIRLAQAAPTDPALRARLRLQQRADDAHGEADYVTVSVADLRAALRSPR